MSDLSGLIVAEKYHVIQAIGQGGMGAVYDAVHAKTGRRVALKLIHERTISVGGPAARRRFEREARATAAIDSLHVVQVLDSGEDERSGMPFIVMEFLQGVDLKTVLSKGPLPQHLAIAIATQISMGLHKAHEGDVIHRDLKPANVFVSKADGGRRIVKLLDFGIAKIAGGEGGISETVDLTTTGDLVGSPPYMSPEQLNSPRDVDKRTDVWALGVVLYEMLCGEVPTHGIHPIGRRVYAICHTPAERIEHRVPGISPKLAEIVHRALEIDPTRRFASVLEMHRELRSLLQGSPELRDIDLAEHAPELVDADPTLTRRAAILNPPSGSTSIFGFATEKSTLPPELTVRSTRSARVWTLAGVSAAGVIAALTVASLITSSSNAPAAAAAPPRITAASLPPPPVATAVETAPAITPTVTASASSAVTAPKPTVVVAKKVPPVVRAAAPKHAADSRDKL